MRLTLTQGVEGFVLKLLQCSFGFRAEFQFRYQNGGVMGAYMYILPYIHLMKCFFSVKDVECLRIYVG